MGAPFVGGWLVTRLSKKSPNRGNCCLLYAQRVLDITGGTIDEYEQTEADLMTESRRTVVDSERGSTTRNEAGYGRAQLE